jgi:hypothetical protein
MSSLKGTDSSPFSSILHLAPLMVLLLVSAFRYAHRYRRDLRVHTRPHRKPSGPALTEFSARSMETAKFRGMGTTPALTSERLNASGNGEAWNSLHARLIALSEQEHACLIALCEQDDRSEVGIADSYVGAGRYESEFR